MIKRKALAALRHPDLPQEIRLKFKKAKDHAETALALQDAEMARLKPKH
jgi:hypothetical protein